jgi:glycosyltransferase involved in cell wall biosynthesis
MFSIITIVKNDAAGLARTIDSVHDQQFENYEYIVIDGGSVDGTVGILRENNDKIDFWISEVDGGISDAFNKGISLSQGDYIQLLNAGDTYLDPQVLLKVSLLAGESVITGIARFGSKTVPPFPLSNDDPLRKRAMISHQASFVRRGVYRDVGLYNPGFKIRMDYEFWLRALRRHRFLFFPERLVDFQAGASMIHLFEFYHEEYVANCCLDGGGGVDYLLALQRFILRSVRRMIGIRL